MKLCAETLLNVEQLDSSLSRNLNRKAGAQIEHNPSIYSNDPFEFVNLVGETVCVWNSYFKLARHALHDISKDVITSRSYNATLDVSQNIVFNLSRKY